jgi:hypothetical protein
MHVTEELPPSIVRRAASIARGPHACPTCESPTWAEPPVPWTELRDYVVRCDQCERPLAVRIDRARILRRGAVPRHLRERHGHHDPVAELLDTRGRRAFALRLATALVIPALAALVAYLLGTSVVGMLVVAAVFVLPGALWGPWLVASLVAGVVSGVRRVVAAVRGLVHSEPMMESTVDVAPGRWDQWLREEKLRQRDRLEHPDAVLRELERVLDERELRRIRALAQRGEVPVDHLEDLLRFRRAWRAEEAERDQLPAFGA